MRDVVQDLYAVSPDDEVTVRLADGTRLSGVPSRVDRDQAGVRIELCPGARNAPQYRIRATRTPGGWQQPTIESRPFLGEWGHEGDVVAVDTHETPQP